MYQAIREEWRDHKDQKDGNKLNRQITLAYKGLSQLRQFGMCACHVDLLLYKESQHQRISQMFGILLTLQTSRR